MAIELDSSTDLTNVAKSDCVQTAKHKPCSAILLSGTININTSVGRLVGRSKFHELTHHFIVTSGLRESVPIALTAGRRFSNGGDRGEWCSRGVAEWSCEGLNCGT